MDQPSESDQPDAQPLTTLRDGIRFERVSYRYPDGTPALDDVSFAARVGELTAVVGPAGSGKTTLAHLAARFLETSDGRVALRRPRRARHHARFRARERRLRVPGDLPLRRQHRGEPAPRRAGCERSGTAARARDGAREGVRRPHAGRTRTRVGRGGSQLSVGQRQRLAIARALVRDAKVLILDEPTSALDPDTEAALVASLREAGRDRLVLIVAHRLSTIRAADQILFLEDGRLLESGTHAELLARPGSPYRRFVEQSVRSRLLIDLAFRAARPDSPRAAPASARTTSGRASRALVTRIRRAAQPTLHSVGWRLRCRLRICARVIAITEIGVLSIKTRLQRSEKPPAPNDRLGWAAVRALPRPTATRLPQEPPR